MDERSQNGVKNMVQMFACVFRQEETVSNEVSHSLAFASFCYYLL
jgi:hypothetical protein